MDLTTDEKWAMAPRPVFVIRMQSLPTEGKPLDFVQELYSEMAEKWAFNPVLPYTNRSILFVMFHAYEGNTREYFW